MRARQEVAEAERPVPVDFVQNCRGVQRVSSLWDFGFGWYGLESRV